MKISLDTFEQEIDETILKRGLSYFKNNKVTDFFEKAPGEFEAIVEGDERYNLTFKIENRVLVENSCSCPYNYGPICKHAVAALFFYLQDELCIQPKGEKKPVTAPKSKAKKDTFNVILNKVGHEELAGFVEKMSATSPDFKNAFLSYFSSYSEDMSVKFYAGQLRPLLTAVRNRYGYADRNKVKAAEVVIDQMLESSDRAIARNLHEVVFHINAALVEEMDRYANHTDDSNGYLNSYIYTALENLTALVALKLDESLRKTMYKYFLDKFRKKKYKGWDWHEKQLKFASSLVTTDKEFDEIIQLLHAADYNEELSFYYRDKYIQMEFELIKHYKGKDEALVFAGLCSNVVFMRRELIQDAVETGDLDAAKMLANNAINFPQENNIRSTIEWEDWLFKIAILEKNPDVLNLALKNFYAAEDNRAIEYFDFVKKVVSSGEWQEILQEILTNLKRSVNWKHEYLFRTICVKENRPDLLFQSLMNNKFHTRVPSEYEEFLLPTHRVGLAQLYVESVKDYLSHNMGKDKYKYAARMIRNIIKIGAHEQAASLISEIRETYYNRPSLLQELNRV